MPRRNRRTPKKPLRPIPFFQEPDRERSCTSKTAYASEAHARAAMLMDGTAARLSVYHCGFCDLWHLTSRKE